MSSPYDFKRLKSLVSIDRVLAEYGLLDKLKKRNHQLFGPCPLHGGDNPTAFRVNIDRGLWHCFTGCGGGDTVELIRKIRKCSYAETARIMHQLSGPTERMRKTHSNFPQNNTQKGFRPFKKTISLNHQSPFLQQKKRISMTTAIRFETGIAYRSAFLKGTVAVRMHSPDGEPLGYCGRRLHENEIAVWGKWRFPQMFPKNDILYNAHRARPFKKQAIIVTECPWSVMRLTQAGFRNAVALLGTSMSSIQFDWISTAPSVILMLDGDNAGRKSAFSISENLKKKTKVHICNLPDGSDPDDLSDFELRSVLHQYLTPSSL